MKTDAVLISSVPNIIYFTTYSGFSEIEREAFLILVGKRKILLTDSRYIHEVSKIKNIEAIELSAGRFLTDSGKELFKALGIKTLGIEENNLTVREFKQLNKFVKTSPINLIQLRTIKNSDEIENIKLACKTSDMAFEFIIKQLNIGKTEKQIANELENYIKSQNGDISFKPIIAFGKNSAIPHHHSDETKLKKNQIVLMDFGVKINNYCSDMTRTVFAGIADDKFKNIYQTVLNAQLKSIEKIKAGVKLSEIDKAAREYITKNDFPNIIHAVGHGIGIEVHEAPNVSPGSNDKIKNGMVFSVEPGIYLPNYGGVRIEDLVLVRDDLPELISKAKREIIEVDV